MKNRFILSATFPAKTSIAIAAVSIFGSNHVIVGCFNDPVIVQDVEEDEFNIFCELINENPVNVIYKK